MPETILILSEDTQTWCLHIHLSEKENCREYTLKNTIYHYDLQVIMEWKRLTNPELPLDPAPYVGDVIPATDLAETM